MVIGQSSENFFSGTVRDSKTKNPIPFVTIYVNGTTKGCHSNEKGEFILKGLKYPCKVVVSQISYNPQVFEIDKNIEGSDIYMTLNIVSLKEVTIESNSTDARTKNLDRFKTWFLGTDYWGTNAELLNDSVLLFYRDEQGFKARASAPLDIMLPELGYRLRVDLVNFLISVNSKFKKEQCFYAAYYYYSPIIPKNKRVASVITKNRLKAYYCSELHFNRSVFKDSLSSNGYQIKRELKSYNQSVFNPNDLKKEYAYDPNNKRTAILSSHKGYQYVILYYQKNGLPIDIQKMNKKPVPNQEFISRIYFIKDSCIIRENGTTADYSVMFDGIIGSKSVGSMLPVSYYPEQSQF
jgi:hypothetical protein